VFCKCFVHRLCKGSVLGPNSGKEDLTRCAQISYPMRSWICGSVHVRILKETNKEEEELVDVAPHWGEPRISCFIVICLFVYVVYVFNFLNPLMLKCFMYE
jgi:hypothetical protein